MPKRLLISFIPNPIKTFIGRKRAKEILYDLPSVIYRAADERMLLSIGFQKSDTMLSRAYWIIHMLERDDKKDFYPFMKSEVFNFLVILRGKLEDHLQKENPHPWAGSYFETVTHALEKVRFIMRADTSILPDPKDGFIEYDHWQHS